VKEATHTMVDRRIVTLWMLVEIAACGGRLSGVPESTDAGALGAGGSRTGGTSATGGVGDSTGTAGVGGFGGASTGTGAGGGSGGFGAGGTGGSSGGSGGASGKGGSGGASGAAGGAPDSGTNACPSGTTPASGRSSACWIGGICEVQPIEPTYSVAESCMRAAGSKAWMSKPIPGGDPWIDAKALLVGQWIACNPAGGIEAIEFGANGRFRHLVKSADGSYVPVSGNPATERGFYWYVNEGGRLDLSDDNVDLTAEAVVDYIETLPTREAIRSNTTSPRFPKGIYARGKPSPSNGWDNPPNIETTTCRIVGTWDTDPNGISPQYRASYSFDEAGNFVVTPGTGVDLCTNHTMYGTYALAPGGLMLNSSVGMGKCGFPDLAGFSLDFTASACSQAKLTVVWDGCSPDRGYLSQPTTLVKRR